MSITSRYCICGVGEGFSVEDKRTGERVSYHRTFGGAQRALRMARGKAPKHPKKSRSVHAVSGGLPSLGKSR